MWCGVVWCGAVRGFAVRCVVFGGFELRLNILGPSFEQRFCK